MPNRYFRQGIFFNKINNLVRIRKNHAKKQKNPKKGLTRAPNTCKMSVVE